MPVFFPFRKLANGVPQQVVGTKLVHVYKCPGACATLLNAMVLDVMLQANGQQVSWPSGLIMNQQLSICFHNEVQAYRSAEVSTRPVALRSGPEQTPILLDHLINFRRLRINGGRT